MRQGIRQGNDEFKGIGISKLGSGNVGKALQCEFKEGNGIDKGEFDNAVADTLTVNQNKEQGTSE